MLLTYKPFRTDYHPTMNTILGRFLLVFALVLGSTLTMAQGTPVSQPTSSPAAMADTIGASASADSAMADDMPEAALAQVDSAAVAPVEHVGFYRALKTKFIEGNAGFMSLVALALVLGLAF